MLIGIAFAVHSKWTIMHMMYHDPETEGQKQ